MTSKTKNRANPKKKEKDDPKKKQMKGIIFAGAVKAILVMLLSTHMQKLNTMEFFQMAPQISKNKTKVNKKEMIGMFQILSATIKKHTNLIEIFKFSLKK